MLLVLMDLLASKLLDIISDQCGVSLLHEVGPASGPWLKVIDRLGVFGDALPLYSLHLGGGEAEEALVLHIGHAACSQVECLGRVRVGLSQQSCLYVILLAIWCLLMHVSIASLIG